MGGEAVSSAGRNKEPRREHDSYQTDPKLARFLAKRLWADGHVRPRGDVLEPSCGVGAFVQAARDVLDARSITARDVVDYSAEPAMDFVTVDFLKTSFEDFNRGENRYDLVIGNPPYKCAEDHVRRGLSLLRVGGTLAFLLRLSFAESKERIEFWRAYPAAHVYVLSERPSFTGGGTDSSAYAFFVWRNQRRLHPTAFEIVSWGGPDRKRAAE